MKDESVRWKYLSGGQPKWIEYSIGNGVGLSLGANSYGWSIKEMIIPTAG